MAELHSHLSLLGGRRIADLAVCVALAAAAMVSLAGSAEARGPESVAEVIVFLASDAGRAVTKTNLLVWGPPS